MPNRKTRSYFLDDGSNSYGTLSTTTREPWTGIVDRQPGADPYHDWNERIHAECYAPNAQAHIIGAQQKVERTVNNYEKISFNFGPTLLSWLETHHPETYNKILAADLVSRKTCSGHGNAIAQAYGHAILPLATDHDRLTQVVWGVADFRHRFGREPESLWLPETACDNLTLDLLIEQQLRYVILAPNQAARVRAAGSEWTSVENGSIDTAKAYRYSGDGSGRSISVFFYDGPAARAIAFEQGLVSSEALSQYSARRRTGPLSTWLRTGTYGIISSLVTCAWPTRWRASS